MDFVQNSEVVIYQETLSHESIYNYDRGQSIIIVNVGLLVFVLCLKNSDSFH